MSLNSNAPTNQLESLQNVRDDKQINLWQFYGTFKKTVQQKLDLVIHYVLNWVLRGNSVVALELKVLRKNVKIQQMRSTTLKLTFVDGWVTESPMAGDE